MHRAVPCALILNELLMNVFKHAFPAGRTGEVRISFGECEPGILELAVQDNGVGCSDSIARCGRKSLGLRIVDILAKQLDGTLHRESVIRNPRGPPLRPETPAPTLDPRHAPLLQSLLHVP